MGQEADEGLAALWEKSRNAVFAQLLAGTGSIHDAEDLLQEVAVSLAKDFEKYDSERPFVAWVLGIARNQLLMYYRRQRRDRLVFNEEVMELVQSNLVRAAEAAEDSRREALLECVKSLPDQRRDLLRMRYGREMGIAEIANELSKSATAIRGQLYRIRQLLADCVDRKQPTV